MTCFKKDEMGKNENKICIGVKTTILKIVRFTILYLFHYFFAFY